MPQHLWMQDLSVAAICPKCQHVAFKRSNTRSGYEKLVRKYTVKVPYRCHECGYRSLLDPTYLRFPATSQKEYEEHAEFSSNVEVPDIVITSIMGNDADKGKFEKSERNSDMSTEPSTPSRLEPEPPVNKGDFETKTEPQLGEEVESIFPDFDSGEGDQDATHRRHRDVRRKHPSGCPSCGDKSLHRSHTRTFMETAMKKVSRKRLYRCHSCDWRGWLEKHV